MLLDMFQPMFPSMAVADLYDGADRLWDTL
jgi:hypothetical protein